MIQHPLIIFKKKFITQQKNYDKIIKNLIELRKSLLVQLVAQVFEGGWVIKSMDVIHVSTHSLTRGGAGRGGAMMPMVPWCHGALWSVAMVSRCECIFHFS